MKILSKKILINDGKFSNTSEYETVLNNIEEAIFAIENPKGSGAFLLYDKKKGNGVKPIKDAFILKLNELGWKDEKLVVDPNLKKRKIDTTKELSTGKYFGVEWETGNISSSHRAINRLLKGMHEGVLEGGVLVLPSRKMYNYLTDRVGNFKELEPYFEVMSDSTAPGILLIIEIEHDGVRDDIPSIKKGTDGRALI
ncbi:hypothetical protein [Cytobacillus firmus]|uniref:hypothetical protein n=1 Tax=Cytobacillus firmus TaxID=1399 RepID=UPI002FFFF20D